MAILFTSPKNGQKTLLWSIVAFFIFAMTIVLFAAFPPRFLGRPQAFVEDHLTPGVKINLSVFDSEQLKNMKPLEVTSPENQEVGRTDPFFPY